MVSDTSCTAVCLVHRQPSSWEGQLGSPVLLLLWVSWLRSVSFTQLCQLDVYIVSFQHLLWKRYGSAYGHKVTKRDELIPLGLIIDMKWVTDVRGNYPGIYSAWPLFSLLNYLQRCVFRSLRDTGNSYQSYSWIARCHTLHFFHFQKSRLHLCELCPRS